uniref:Uncharacterized protein n=1 Tax=Thermogemmatispora argillosa TaxID=2045280 RepID=A0A455T8X4_9CHLR|nr:hypothetical protein KTA_40900 [Thermogemmatispora argillosa]
MATAPQPLRGAREQSSRSCPRCRRRPGPNHTTYHLMPPSLIIPPHPPSSPWSQQLRRLLFYPEQAQKEARA